MISFILPLVKEENKNKARLKRKKPTLLEESLLVTNFL
jgi:hypothetical protein